MLHRFFERSYQGQVSPVVKRKSTINCGQLHIRTGWDKSCKLLLQLTKCLHPVTRNFGYSGSGSSGHFQETMFGVLTVFAPPMSCWCVPFRCARNVSKAALPTAIRVRCRIPLRWFNSEISANNLDCTWTICGWQSHALFASWSAESLPLRTHLSAGSATLERSWWLLTFWIPTHKCSSGRSLSARLWSIWLGFLFARATSSKTCPAASFRTAFHTVWLSIQMVKGLGCLETKARAAITAIYSARVIVWIMPDTMPLATGKNSMSASKVPTVTPQAPSLASLSWGDLQLPSVKIWISAGKLFGAQTSL